MHDLEIIAAVGAVEEKDSLMMSTFETILVAKFHLLYDCFFKIIKERLSTFQHNEKGQIDELMYKESSVRYLLDPKKSQEQDLEAKTKNKT